MLASRLRNITTIKELKHEIAYGESLGAKAIAKKRSILAWMIILTLITTRWLCASF